MHIFTNLLTYFYFHLTRVVRLIDYIKKLKGNTIVCTVPYSCIQYYEESIIKLLILEIKMCSLKCHYVMYS